MVKVIRRAWNANVLLGSLESLSVTLWCDLRD